MTKIKDLTPAKSDEVLLNEMMQELQTLNKLAVLKEEDNIVRDILRGKARTRVLAELQEKYPKDRIVKNDLDEFLVLYKDVLFHKKTDVEKAYVRRLLKSQEGLTNEMIGLADVAKGMIKKYDNEGDNTNAVSALRTAADIFMKFAKIQGLTQDQPEVNINMQMDKLVTEVTAGDSVFKQSVLKVLEKKDEPVIIDVDVDDTNSREG